MTPEKQWYAVYTKPRWEKKTSDQLNKRQIDNYCPLNKVVRNWSDRKKTILEPLFKSYVFINVAEKELGEVRKADGVLNFVYWLGKPAVIKNAEIEAIKDFLEEFPNVRLENIDVDIHDTVRIKRGPFMELEGDIIGVKNKTVSVFLPSLGYSLVAEVEKSNLEVLTKADTFKTSSVGGRLYQRAI